MRASTWPWLTKSPSSTRISATRPGNWVATSSSVASLRPLPLARPSPIPSLRRPYQAPALPVTNSRPRARADLRLLRDFIRCSSISIQRERG
ncbi:hypothetical protein D9M69_628900 [compost metagenome]